MRSDLTPEPKGKIRRAFYELRDPAILKPLKADGFAPIRDTDYDVIRNAAEILGLVLGSLERRVADTHGRVRSTKPRLCPACSMREASLPPPSLPACVRFSPRAGGTCSAARFGREASSFSSWPAWGTLIFFNPRRYTEGAHGIFQIIVREGLPPDFSRLASWGGPLPDTFAMSIAGTALSVLFFVRPRLSRGPQHHPPPPGLRRGASS